MCEKDLLSPTASEDQIQWGYAQLQNIRGPDGQDAAAPTLYKRLGTAVLIAYADAANLVLFLRNWCTMEEGISFL